MEVLNTYQDYLLKNKEKVTCYQYLSHLKHLINHTKIQHINLFNMVDADVVEWIATMYLENLSVASINAKITASKNFFNYLIAEKKIYKNPFVKTKLIKNAPRNFKYIDLKIIREKIAVFEPRHATEKLYFAIFYGILNLGISVQDLKKIKIKDIDNKEHTIVLSKKNTKSVHYKIDLVFEKMLHHLMIDKEKNSYLFTTERKKPIQENIIKEVIAFFNTFTNEILRL